MCVGASCRRCTVRPSRSCGTSGAVPASDTDDKGLTARTCSYRVSVQSRGAGRSGLPTGNGYRRRANRGVRRSHGPQTGPDCKAMSVAGRRCGQASSHGELSWRRTRRDCFLFPLSWFPRRLLHGFNQRFALCDSSGIDPMPGWRAYARQSGYRGAIA